MKLLSFFLTIALLTTISCKKDLKEISENNFEVRKNSQSWPGSKFEGYLGNEDKLTILLFGQGEEYIALTFDKPPHNGDVKDFGSGYISLLGGDVITDNQQLDKTKPYSFEITSFNAESRQVAGHFSFTVKRDDWFTKGIGAQSNRFTGRFNIVYQNQGR